MNQCESLFVTMESPLYCESLRPRSLLGTASPGGLLLTLTGTVIQVCKRRAPGLGPTRLLKNGLTALALSIAPGALSE